VHILVTGGAGYIGSHTVLELLNAGYKVSVIDNLSNSSIEALKRVTTITGKKSINYTFDLRNTDKLDNLFAKNDFDAVIHFAGLKAVGESVKEPLHYYSNNIGSSLSLLKTMQKHQVKQLVFSSSATVYGSPKTVPIKESDPTGQNITNPYGKTKYFIEEMLKDLSLTNEGWHITSLRYFNPVGAHPSGLIGEDPNGLPNNLMPYISQVAVGKIKSLQVFGNDYPTADGTGIRDYIHVVDLAKAHLASIQTPAKAGQYRAINIGTGHGTSVLQLLKTFIDVNNVIIPYKIVGRRPGDVAFCYADATRAEKLLGFKTTKTLDQCCQDAWRWQSHNPNGYN
jgi:UDP-glucose 4-epimerase